ncbi:MAG TPA: hypothetical protein VKK61_04045 [Tepidisphaeraceae bacterium]|nr:hypothetical protein [Tepidisphaeraceae bacterium]
MSQINPFVSSILQTPLAQRQQSDDRDRQVRKANDLEKDAALTDDQLEHQVESSEEVTPIKEQEKQERRFKRYKHDHSSDDEEESGEDPHLDLTA